MTPFKTAAVLAAALWTLVCGVDGTLDYSRVHIVDQNKETGNFLFRGNMPVNSSDNSFQYQTLVKYMGMRAEEANVTLPADFTLVDISLNNLFDKALKVEKAFWKNPANAKYGKFINWPLGLAGIVPPSKFSPSEQRKMANSTVWKIDKIPARITAIREMLETKTDKPTVVDFAMVEGDGTVTRELADHALTRLGVDNLGLDGADRRYLLLIAENYAGGPVGIETMSAALSESRDALEEVIEPFLLQKGLIQRTPRGRMLAQKGWDHLGMAAPKAQGALFE